MTTNEDQTPTLMELARLRDTAKHANEHKPHDPEAGRITLWLFRQIPEINALWEEMTEDPGHRPPMWELAKFVFSISSPRRHECEKTGRWLLNRAPGTAVLMAKLETYRRDEEPCDKSVEGWRETLEHNLCVDRLAEALESGQDWSNPSDILDHRNDRGFEHNALHRICTARIARAEGEKKKLLEGVETRLRFYGRRAS